MAYGTIKVDNITFDNGGVDKLITVSGLFYSTSGALTVTGAISGGRVTAPTATFTTLTGTTTAGTTATFTSGSFTSLTGVTTTVTSGIFGLGSAAAPSIIISGAGIYSPGANQLAIATSGTGRLFVDGSGNVGVGTGGTAPGASLHVAGAIASAPTGSGLLAGINGNYAQAKLYGSTGGLLDFGASGADASARIRVDNSDSALQFFTKSGSLFERMRLDSSGNVGIGGVPANYTGYPNIRINGTSGGILDLSTNGTSVFRLTGDTNGVAYYTQNTSYPHIWGAGATERMRLDSSGNLGLGVVPSNWNQGVNIDIGQASGIGNHSNLTQISNNRVLTAGVNYYKITGAASIYSTGAGQHAWYVAPSGTAGAAISFTQAMTLDGLGNLGLGATSPSSYVQNGGLAVVRNANNSQAHVCFSNSSNGSSAAESVVIGSDTASCLITTTSSAWGNYGILKTASTTISSTNFLAFGSASGFIFGTGAGPYNEVARIDSSGNLGLGVVPSVWGSPFVAMQISTGGAALTGRTDSQQVTLSTNWRFAGGSNLYISNGFASRYLQESGAHSWLTAPFGTAGNAITFTQAMTLDASGNLGIAQTSPSSYNASARQLVIGNNVGSVGITIAPGTSTTNQGSIFFASGTGTSAQQANGFIAYENNANYMTFGTVNTEHMRIDSVGTTVLTANSSSPPLVAKISSTEAVRIDGSGRLLVGTSSSLAIGSSVNGQLQVANTTVAIGSISTFVNGASGAYLMLGKSRGGTVGTYTIVQSGDQLGVINFAGADGVNLQAVGASIASFVDGTPGANDMPGRLVFSTTADGAASPTERMRIDSAGNVGIGATPVAWFTGSNWKVIDLPSAAFRGGNQGAAIYANSYVNSSIVPIYKNSGAYALAYQQQADTGNHAWFIAPSGTAGNTITFTQAMTLDASGRFLVGTIASPAHQLQVSTDSAGKPSTNTWTIVSDERIKEEIELADLDLCYEAVKSIPLKRFKWKDEVYTEEQVRDRRKLGWIAQDVEAVFPKAVGTYEFKYNQVFEETIIPAVEEELDSEGNVTTPAQPERIEKGELISEDVIEDCRDLNSDQLYAAMYGAIQKLMAKVETLEASNADMLARLSALEAA